MSKRKELLYKVKDVIDEARIHLSPAEFVEFCADIITIGNEQWAKSREKLMSKPLFRWHSA